MRCSCGCSVFQTGYIQDFEANQADQPNWRLAMCVSCSKKYLVTQGKAQLFPLNLLWKEAPNEV